MKLTSLQKKLICLSAFAAIFLPVFAQNADDNYETEEPTPIKIEKNEKSNADSYSEPDFYEDNKTDKKSKKNTKTKTDKPKKSFGESFKEFIVGKEKYIYYAEIKLSTGTFGYGIKNRQSQMILNPETQKAGIQTYFQTSWFNFLFDEFNRQSIIDAYSKYLEDFNNHTLIKGKTLKTRSAYVKNGKCYEEFGIVRSMMDAYANTKFTVGYEFKKINEKVSPFFCIIIKMADNENERMGTNSVKQSVEVELYFTKAQAKDFVTYLSLDSINNEMQKVNDYNDTFKEDTDYLNNSDVEEADSDKEIEASDSEEVNTETSSESKTLSEESDNSQKE